MRKVRLRKNVEVNWHMALIVHKTYIVDSFYRYYTFDDYVTHRDKWWRSVLRRVGL